MSSIIQVSYQEEEKKNLLEKLKEHLGVHKVTIYLKSGENTEGIINEIGQDYLAVIEDRSDVLIPLKNIDFIRYQG